MLATAISVETVKKPKQIVKVCQLEFSQFVQFFNMATFGERLRTAFGNAKNAEIARKMKVSEAAVKNYMNGRVPDHEKLLQIKSLTNCSLDWLLAGDEPVEPIRRKASFDPILNRDALTELVREVVRSEMGQEVQDLGTVDEFNVALAIQKYDNPATVLAKWYEFDGIDMQGVETTRPSGWIKMSLEQKVKEIRAVRGIIDRQQLRKAHAPKQPKATKKIQ